MPVFLQRSPRNRLSYIIHRTIRISIMCLAGQSCPTLCNLMECSPPGSSVHGILQVSIQEWVVAMPFSRASSQPRGVEPRSPALQVDSYSLSHQGSL